MSRDNVYSEIRQIVDFAFDDQVVAVFPDMIRRSVPGYETVIPMSGLLAARHAAAGGTCYDLGCSLGATALSIVRALNTPGVDVVAVDNAPAMIERGARELAAEPIRWVLGDIRTTSLDNACAVVMNYTLQFLAPEERLPLLRRIREHLVPEPPVPEHSGAGALILSEKIRYADPAQQAYFEAAHLDFKRANGYSELEISQKRTALEHVMRPDTLEDHQTRLAEAGFSRVDVWFRCLNWVSILARP